MEGKCFKQSVFSNELMSGKAQTLGDHSEIMSMGRGFRKTEKLLHRVSEKKKLS